MKRIAPTLACLILVLMITATIEASTAQNGRYVDAQGHIYIIKNGKLRTGYFYYHGKLYYGHRTGSKKYPKGSCTAGDMRIRNGKWYAFDVYGRRIEKDQYRIKGRNRKILVLDIRHKNKTVRYIYGTTRRTLGTRYSTAEMRMQEEDTFGRWRTIEGMPFLPDYVDMQK
ncbi:MAG: hypothetical protein Q4D81_00420 [Eubacteriales bacterium]|nr:hypothetical protein [Eubacteriales bacterium]